MEKQTAILGFGNPVRSDDAIGIYVIKELEKILAPENYPQLKILDMGTSAFEVLFQLKGQERLIFVDAVINTEDPIGTVYKVPAQELATEPEEDPMVFLHNLKWSQALSYARKIMGDTFPEDIQVYLIAIENTRLEIELHPEVQAAGEKVVKEILKDLAVEIAY